MKTSGGLPAAIALAYAASSLPGTNLTVSHGYFVCSLARSSLNALTSLPSVLNVHTVIVVGAWLAFVEIADATVGVGLAPPPPPPAVHPVTNKAAIVAVAASAVLGRFMWIPLTVGWTDDGCYGVARDAAE